MSKNSIIQNIYPLSPMQEGMLFHNLMSDDKKEYFEQTSLKINLNIDTALLLESFNTLIDRYDVLRTVFVYKGQNKPRQVVLKTAKFKLTIEDISTLSQQDKDIYVKNFKEADRNKGFDLSKEISIRAAIIKVNEQEQLLIFSFHHIIMDGWSVPIIFNELFSIYNALKNKITLQLPKVNNYGQYINWLNNQEKGDALAYWSEYLKDYEKECKVPANLNTNSEDIYIGKQEVLSIDEKRTSELKNIASQNNVTVNLIFQAIWGIILAKYNDTKDAVFGSVVSGRPSEIKGIETMVGMFLNTVPVRIKLDDNKNLYKLLEELKIDLIESTKYEYLPLAEIQANTTLKQQLIDNIYIFENYPVEKYNEHFEKGLKMDIEVDECYEQTNYGFTISISMSNKITIALAYNASIYCEEFVKSVSGHFNKVVDVIIENPEMVLSDIDILGDEEKRLLLKQFNGVELDYPQNLTIQHLFEQQVNKKPNEIAVVFEGEALTYRELNSKSNALARTLREKGAGPEKIVGIMINRSVEMIIGIMAIIKSGAAYMPVDPDYPDERINYLLQNSDVELLVTDQEQIPSKPSNCEIININNANIYSENTTDLEIINSQKDLLYLLYTSGTTGTPKGVMVEQGNVVNIALAWIDSYNLNKFKVNLLQMASMSFDVFTGDLCRTLLTGGTMYICSNDIRIDMQKLYNTISENEISILESTPSLLITFMDYVKSRSLELDKLKLLILGSDNCPIEDYKRLVKEYGKSMRILNSYGVTECTIDSSYYEEKIENISHNLVNTPIGKAMQNTKFYVLNESLNLVPIGVIGQLYIGGSGVARGYFNNKALTDERFIDDPFVLGRKMYKTGDLARWLPDGNLEFLGRMDNQVKIRGFRIELGEIENRLLQNQNIKAAVVIPRENAFKDKYLCAYIVGDKAVADLDLKAYLRLSLPEYMIPLHFINLEKLPITPNGKIDKKALLETAIDDNSKEYEAPRNKAEEIIANVWSEVLAVERIGINENFFELGGHSLKATVLVSKLHEKLNRQIPLKVLFKTPTIKGLSEFLQNAVENPYSNIPKVDQSQAYETSSAQKRMYILQQFDRDNIAYNMPAIYEIQGEINKEKLETVFNALIKRHESLRTYFELIDGEIVQKVHEDLNFTIDEKIIASNINSAADDFIRSFDLGKAPLFRVEIAKLGQTNYLLMDIHHIISDGVSSNVLTKEFASLYNGESLQPLKLQYKDFAAWQNDFMKSELMKEQENYWINRFSGEVPVLNLPTDYERPHLQSFEGNTISFEIEGEIIKGLKNLTRSTGSTVQMVLLSAFNILLSKYSGSEDVVIGVPIAGRPHAQLQNIMGMFVNTLALRNIPEGNKKYIDFINEVKENSLNAYENQSYQLEALVEKLNINRDSSRNPLFDVVFNMMDLSDDNNIELTDIGLKPYNSQSVISKFDITLHAAENRHKLCFALEYCTKLFKRETIEKLSKDYANILDIIIKTPEINLKDIDMLTTEEKELILDKFNDTTIEYPDKKTIQELFEEQVMKTPNKPAVVFEGEQLTYEELNEKCNSIASLLREKGVKPDVLVGIMVEKSLDMIIAILGVLKSGAAYLPIDPSYPRERIEYMLEDSKVNIILSSDSAMKDLDFKGEILDLKKAELNKQVKDNPEIINSSKDLAYVLYTSGTTGRPKGVMVEHKSVVRLIKNTNYIEFNGEDRILQTGSIVFDASTFEIWGALLNGLSLYLCRNEIIIDAQKLENAINENNITILWLTSELFNQVTQQNLGVFRNLRYLLVGGDVLSPKYINLVRETYVDLKIINGYGPTENTTFSTTHHINKCYNINIPIGEPIANSKAYIVDKNNMLSGIGVCGELCVSGDGLARGYLNNPELTKEKFINNPFEQGAKMYKTGDLARWLPSGSIEFLGRIDNQVKLRGYRIEPLEIERQIYQNDKVKAAVVILKENDNKEKYLCAYVVSEISLEELNLKAYLREYLPEYMIPSYITQVDEMPMTSNGKLDKKALPEPAAVSHLDSYEAPRNDVEKVLVNIWCQVLGIERVGIGDNFFELGGHSLKAMVLISKIHEELNREVPLKELFKSPTIRGLGEFLQSAKENIYQSIDKVKESPYYEASSAQKRMYILNQFDKDNVAYNMPIVLQLQDEINKERLENVFKQLVKRHEVLRTYFETVDGEIVQRLDNSFEFKLEYVVSNENIDSIIMDFVRSFDLGKAPLFRSKIVENKGNKYLLIDMHHIISDGVSMAILVKEFTSLYNGQTLKHLRLQYKDFAKWQNDYLRSDKLKAQEEYWLNSLSDDIPVLNMPTDYERPPIQNFEGASISFQVKGELLKQHKNLTKAWGCTTQMVLLSALNILLSKYSGDEDIIIGVPIAGRPHAELQDIMGLFVNTLALRNRPLGNKKYIDFLREVKENSLKAYENESYQFETLVEKLNLRRDSSRNPLFDVALNTLETVGDSNAELKGLSLKPYNAEDTISKFDITLNAIEGEDELSFSIEYAVKLFKKESIQKMGEYFINVLSEVFNNPQIELKNIDILSKEERKQLLYGFNEVKCDYTQNKTVQELFELQVNKNPDNIAVVFEDTSLTYKELNEKSNSLARILRKKGVKSDSIVGIMVNRSIEMIVGIMAIIKSGGAYLPIDPTYPIERIEYMLKDSKANILLSKDSLVESLEFDGEIIDLFADNLYENECDNLEIINSSNDLVYVIYTSGTTGRPKGVMVEHHNLISFIYSFSIPFDKGFSSEDVVLNSANYIFDASVCEFFIALLNGAALVVNHNSFDPGQIAKLICEKEVTFTFITPSLLPSVYQKLKSAKDNGINIKFNKLFVGAESIKGKILKDFFALNEDMEIVNAYGPTEATVCSTLYKVKLDESDDQTVTIGSPIANANVYILNKFLSLVPVGVVGEIYVSGDAVTRGYLNNTELTLEKFIDNPFESGKKMYKTGDLAKWLPNGNVDFLGRIDNQVKIRGFRIELGEIESRLLQHESIKGAVVVAKENESNEKYLCAYIVSEKSSQELNLRAYLKMNLPEYMIPAYYTFLDKMPLTRNGKIDKTALPEPNFEGSLNEYEAPKNETEIIIASLWSELLGINKIGINNNFFELGGHSLKATVLISKIHKEFNKEVPLKEFFKSPTIKGLSEFLQNAEENIYSAIQKVEESEYYETSSAQKRMYILNQFDKDNVAYNMPIILQLQGEINRERFENAFKKLVKRHEALRTYFQTVDGEIVQMLNNSFEFNLEHIISNENIDSLVKDFVISF